MNEDESAIKFLFRFRKFQEQLDLHSIDLDEDKIVDHLLTIIYDKPHYNPYKTLIIGLQQDRRMKRQYTINDLEAIFQDVDARQKKSNRFNKHKDKKDKKSDEANVVQTPNDNKSKNKKNKRKEQL